MKDLTRRDALVLAAGALVSSALPAQSAAADAIMAFTGGAALREDGVTLTAPTLAENGYIVPIGIAAPGAAELVLFAPANPEPKVAAFRFGSLAAQAAVSTRIRMAETQDLVAVARMPDGSFRAARAYVVVTLGGCGA